MFTKEQIDELENEFKKCVGLQNLNRKSLSQALHNCIQQYTNDNIIISIDIQRYYEEKSPYRIKSEIFFGEEEHREAKEQLKNSTHKILYFYIKDIDVKPEDKIKPFSERHWTPCKRVDNNKRYYINKITDCSVLCSQISWCDLDKGGYDEESFHYSKRLNKDLIVTALVGGDVKIVDRDKFNNDEIVWLE